MIKRKVIITRRNIEKEKFPEESVVVVELSKEFVTVTPDIALPLEASLTVPEREPLVSKVSSDLPQLKNMKDPRDKTKKDF